MHHIDAELVFECLIYLNTFYCVVFSTCDTVMTVAKYVSVRKETPNIHWDGAVTFTKMVLEVAKILLFQKFKEERRKLATAVVLTINIAIIGPLYYAFVIQDPTLKLENMLNTLLGCLICTEIGFGVMYLSPCYKQQYYY